MIRLTTFYIFIVDNKSCENTKTNHVLVRLSILPDSPILPVALSHEHVCSITDINL